MRLSSGSGTTHAPTVKYKKIDYNSCSFSSIEYAMFAENQDKAESSITPCIK